MEQGLGARRAVFSFKPNGGVVGKVIMKCAVPFLWIATILSGFICAGHWYLYFHDLPVKHDMLVAFSIMFCLSLYGLFFIQNIRYRYIVLYEQGFITGTKKKKIVVPFCDIKSIRQASYQQIPGRASYLIIRTTDNKRINLRGIPTATDPIEQAFIQQRLPILISQLQSGAEIEIGRFILTQNGLKTKKEFCPWDQIADIVLTKGELSIWQKNRAPKKVWQRVNLELYHNAILLQPIIQNYIRREQYPGFTFG